MRENRVQSGKQPVVLWLSNPTATEYKTHGADHTSDDEFSVTPQGSPGQTQPSQMT